MRPRSLDDYWGQQHILGPGKLLRRAVEADRFSSLIFYGPPGVGKTSLAQVIADNENIERCFARHVYRYGAGRLEAEGGVYQWVVQSFHGSSPAGRWP